MKDKNKERLDTAQKVTSTGSNILKGIWYAILIAIIITVIVVGARLFNNITSFLGL